MISAESIPSQQFSKSGMGDNIAHHLSMSRPRRPLPISTLLARLGTVAGIALAVYTVVTLIGFLSQRSYLPAGSTLAGLDRG